MAAIHERNGNFRVMFRHHEKPALLASGVLVEAHMEYPVLAVFDGPVILPSR